jgi:hypothetical protein
MREPASHLPSSVVFGRHARDFSSFTVTIPAISPLRKVRTISDQPSESGRAAPTTDHTTKATRKPMG